MTKLLHPVKPGGLETPHREIDTCHTHAHTYIHCVQQEYLLLAGGAAFMWEIRAQGWLRAGLSDSGLGAVSVNTQLFICVFFLPSASRSSSVDLLNSSYSSVCSGHSSALPHHQVPNAEVVPQWDDDEEGVQGSEVSDRHRWLYPPAASRPS